VTVDRVLAAFRAVLPSSAEVTATARDGRSLMLRVGDTPVRVRWLERGWPRQVREALDADPSTDVLAAPRMSAGARAAAEDTGVGWIDETGAGEFTVGSVVVAKSPPTPVQEREPPRSWTPATLGVVEALLTGTPATVTAVSDRTGLSEGTATRALAHLTKAGLLAADAARGRYSRRRVKDPVELLEAYADAAIALRPTIVLQAGLSARDLMGAMAAVGRRWNAMGQVWAATSTLAAAAQAAYLTEVSAIEVYVAGSAYSDLRIAARNAELTLIRGGRLALRPFPGPATERLRQHVAGELYCVPWPRTYADLRVIGVRGEDAAEHLREQFLNRIET
jgi:MarR family